MERYGTHSSYLELVVMTLRNSFEWLFFLDRTRWVVSLRFQPLVGSPLKSQTRWGSYGYITFKKNKNKKKQGGRLLLDSSIDLDPFTPMGVALVY